MSEVPLLDSENVLPLDVLSPRSSDQERSRNLPILFLRDEFGRALTPYQRQKALGERRANGALNLKSLNTKHLKIIQMHLAGWSGGAIAHQMGTTQSRVSLVLTDPLAKAIISQAHEDVKGEIRALTRKGVSVVRDVMLSDQSTVAAKFKAIDKLKTLHDMTGSEERPATAEDLVQNLLKSGSTINLQINNNTVREKEVAGANQYSIDPDLDGDD